MGCESGEATIKLVFMQMKNQVASMDLWDYKKIYRSGCYRLFTCYMVVIDLCMFNFFS